MATTLTAANDSATLMQGYFGQINGGATQSMNGVTLDGAAGTDTLTVYFPKAFFTQTTNAAGVTTISTASGKAIHLTHFESIAYMDTTVSLGAGSGAGGGTSTTEGTTGNDTLAGTAGADAFNGGTGDDTYTVNAAGDTITEASGGGTDTANSSVSYTLPSYVENIVLTKTAAIDATGNDLANTITGNAGNNILSGAAGNDTLSGGAGNDRLDGGAGNDSMDGGAGNDIYVVDSASDIVVEAANTAALKFGIDTVRTDLASYTLGSNLEKLAYTGSSAFAGTGNGLANEIAGGTGNDTLDGGAGADKLIGGAGDDTYVIDSAADRIVEKAAQGTDTVTTALAKFSLAAIDGATALPLFAQVENLVYTGSAAFTGTGNGAANAITGGAAADKLAGAAGNDTLTGNAGNDAENGGAGNDTLHGDDGADTLVGGAGSDNFVFDTAPASGNADLITDFALGDKIQLDDAVFTTLSVGALTDAAFCLGTAAAAADDRIIYDKASGSLYYDADGSGAGAATLIATVGTSLHAALTAASFEVI